LCLIDGRRGRRREEMKKGDGKDHCEPDVHG
jgi:hypothetical protein